MKVLLIDPPYERLIGFKSEWFPLGLASLASYLIEKGYDEIGIYHAEHTLTTEYKSIVKYSESFHQYKESIDVDDHPVWQEAREKVASYKPDLVGISVWTPKVPSAFRIARICKEANPKVKIVFGGHHSTIKPDEMLSSKDVDFVIRGEGEETFYELLKVLQSRDMIFHDVAGLSFRSKGSIVHNRGRELIQDLNRLPFPTRDRIFDIETYTPVQLSMIMTSRGCPYGCGFCASRNMWRRKVRVRSIDDILNEINELKNRYKIKNFTIMDDAFTIDRNRVIEFCSALIDRRMGISWSCLTRVDIISDELIALMKKAGCTKVDVGIESGSQRVLDMIGKKITLKKVRNAVDILRRNKMFWSGFFMFGFPSETEEEVFDTLNFLKELKPNWANISIFTPYPGTALYEISVQKGMITDPPDYALYSHQNPYNRWTDKIPQERFGKIATDVLHEVHKYNSSYRSLIKRALTRQYHRNPSLIVEDAAKVMSWLQK